MFLALGVAIILVCLPTIVWQQYRYNQAAITAHDQTVALLQEHTTTLAAVAAEDRSLLSLQGQVEKVIVALPAADKYLGELALGLEAQIIALCNATGAHCAPLNTANP
jgi:hypothetical protein